MQLNELEQAADEFSKKRLCFDDSLKYYDERQYAGFKAGANWQKEQSQKEIDRLNAYIEDLSKGYEH